MRVQGIAGGRRPPGLSYKFADANAYRFPLWSVEQLTGGAPSMPGVERLTFVSGRLPMRLA